MQWHPSSTTHLHTAKPPFAASGGFWGSQERGGEAGQGGQGRGKGGGGCCRSEDTAACQASFDASGGLGGPRKGRGVRARRGREGAKGGEGV